MGSKKHSSFRWRSDQSYHMGPKCRFQICKLSFTKPKSIWCVIFTDNDLYHFICFSTDLFRAAILFSGTSVSRIAFTPYKKENALNLAKVLNPSLISTESEDLLNELMNHSAEDIQKAQTSVRHKLK